MLGDHDTSWMYIFSVLSTKGSTQQCCSTFRLLNCSGDTDCLSCASSCRNNEQPHSGGKMWRPKKKNELTVLTGWFIICESMRSVQNSTSTCGLCFLMYWKQHLFVSSASVCPWAENKVCNSHLSPFQISSCWRTWFRSYCKCDIFIFLYLSKMYWIHYKDELISVSSLLKTPCNGSESLIDHVWLWLEGNAGGNYAS